ncbi:MAG TPA: HlyD family type I secretion periplasmic adaptor subunit [Coxiellaceae bacterium]|nr:HlyD family type I secretion periplasmic adaptor subunit [Coxiellaceae bacterium]
MKRRHIYKQLQFISNATVLEEGDRFRLIRKGVLVISIVFFLLLLWSAFASINEVAITVGQIQPYDKSYPIQHLEGGIIDEVYVHNDQKVKEGDPLIKMDPIHAQSQLAIDEAQAVNLTLDIVRLQAFLDNKAPDEVDWVGSISSSQFDMINDKNQIYDLIQNEQSQLARENASQASKITEQENQIAQDKERIRNLDTKISTAKTQSDLFSRELAMYENLVKKHYVSEKDYLTAKRRMNEASEVITDLQSEKVAAEGALKESQAKLESFRADREATAHQQLSETKASLIRIQQNLKQLSDQAQRTVIRAPISGIVQGIEGKKDSIIAPRQKIMEIIPSDQELVVESRVRPRDIGHITVGDKVNVKIYTFDYVRYGGVEGSVVSISPSTYTDPASGLLYYKATIELNKNYIGKDPKKNLLKPGMSVQADIITDRRSLLKYLLKPVQGTVSESFGER